ncbi:trypsin delta-like [Schistocerca nitens]|uniref:trypsin delta-like n=1 Tax=Schistocerca nitens TaxID=7011 RepID=UPI0021196F43|nr:trypsin delta-like [Schistocerca nitens]
MLRSVCLLLFATVAGVLCTAGRTARHGPSVSVVNGRIINGVDAAPGEFPAQLSMQTDGRHFCGASILNENWAITAAHCFDNGGSVEVLAGTTKLDSGGTRHSVEFVEVHPKYNSSDSWVNDVAVMRVSPPFQIDNVTVARIQLPAEGEETPAGTNVTVIGWGRLSYGGARPNDLQKVDVQVWDQQLCATLFWDGFENTVYPTMLCAAGVEEQASSCSGDSGGPLLRDGVMVGIVSWSFQCATPPYPTVYTRVSSYLDWIRENAGSW